jgi:hypothetical protein
VIGDGAGHAKVKKFIEEHKHSPDMLLVQASKRFVQQKKLRSVHGDA